MLVFVPVTKAELAQLRGGARLEMCSGFAATPPMLAAFGFTDDAGEEAEYTSLNIAGLAGWLTNGERIVVVAEVEANGSADPFGAVMIPKLSYETVTCVFATARKDKKPAKSLVEGGLAQAWEDETAQELTCSNPLLWYGSNETIELSA